tara:strand:+ start:532 stop:765 length:234 start_codon:yes stop_codon:yes gene_type:complete
MKSLALVFFVAGIVFLVVGYTEMEILEKREVRDVEYRFVPRSVYDQIGSIEVSEYYNDLFLSKDPYYERGSLPTNLV